MTGYGRGEATLDGITTIVEIRSVNSRYFEVAAKLPRSVSHRENDVKELLRKKIVRGKLSVVISIQHSNNSAELPLAINLPAAKMYYALLKELKKKLKLREQIGIDHLLKFSEIFEPPDITKEDNNEWLSTEAALDLAVDDLAMMRRKEGHELGLDVEKRLHQMERLIDENERVSKERIDIERTQLREKVHKLLEDPSIIDDKRLEFEITMLADKLDITEECVRFHSHIKFFLAALANEEAAGRKLNFLLQEMNREANTIGSKSYDSEISHNVVTIKEELEKIREQLQNIE
ncbi:MAG: YicC/YloC family endoribonuclease [Bacteroidota bacterium]